MIFNGFSIIPHCHFSCYFMLSIGSRIATSSRRSLKFKRAEDKTGYPPDGVTKQTWLKGRETLIFTWKTEDKVSVSPIYISLLPARGGSRAVRRTKRVWSERDTLRLWAPWPGSESAGHMGYVSQSLGRNELLFTQMCARILREYSSKTHDLYFWFNRKMASNETLDLME